MNAIYGAEHITKTFGHGKNEVQAVKDVSFEPGGGPDHQHRRRERLRQVDHRPDGAGSAADHLAAS